MTLARGDVALVRFPHTAGGRGKKRPVVVAQADAYNARLNRVVVAASRLHCCSSWTA